MKWRAVAVGSVLALVFATTSSMAADERTEQDVFAQAVALMNAKKFAEALPILEAMAAKHPTTGILWNLGQSAVEVGDYPKALRAWQAYRIEKPDDWHVRTKLVQAYQALGDLTARDRERAELVALWQAGTNAELSQQQVFCREQLRVDGKKVMALEYFKPAGPTMVVYSFVVLGDDGKQQFKVSLGSYDVTNQVALELGERPKDKRLYHLDLYRENLHQTHGFFLGQPGYDVIRPLVLDVIAGKHKPASASTHPAGTQAAPT